MLSMKKGMPWASPSLDAWVFLIYAGVNHRGIPKLRAFTLLDHIVSSSSLDPWKLPPHQTRNTLIRGLVHNQKFTCSEVTQSFLTLLDIAQSYWKLMEQRNPSNIAKEAMRNKRQNLSKQNSPSRRIFSRHLTCSDEEAQIEWKLRTYLRITHKNWQIFLSYLQRIQPKFVTARNLFLRSNPNLVWTLLSKTLLGTTMQQN